MKPHSLHSALQVSIVYLIISTIWILFSDRISARFVTDPVQLTQIQTIKGWFFVLASSILIFWLVLQQIRKLDRAEQNYRLLFEVAADGIFIADQQGNYLDVNTSGCLMLGYPREEILEKNIRDLIASDDQMVYPLRLDELRAGNNVLTERYMVHKDGHLLPVEISSRQLPDGRFQGIVRDISVRKENERELAASQQQLRDLARRLAESEEDQRKSLARELHDRAGQLLTALSINLNLVRTILLPDNHSAALERLEESQRIVEEATMRIRDIMGELRPPALDDYGLAAALRWYARRLNARLPFEISVSASEEARLPPSVEIALFRITQEALNNVAKHAQASQVWIHLDRSSDRVSLSIQDNGIGFAAHQRQEQTGWGFKIMKERAAAVGGKLEIFAEPGKGTTLQVTLEGPYYEHTSSISG